MGSPYNVIYQSSPGFSAVKLWTEPDLNYFQCSVKTKFVSGIKPQETPVLEKGPRYLVISPLMGHSGRLVDLNMYYSSLGFSAVELRIESTFNPFQQYTWQGYQVTPKTHPCYEERPRSVLPLYWGMVEAPMNQSRIPLFGLRIGGQGVNITHFLQVTPLRKPFITRYLFYRYTNSNVININFQICISVHWKNWCYHERFHNHEWAIHFKAICISLQEGLDHPARSLDRWLSHQISSQLT